MRPRRPIFRRSKAAAPPQPDNTHVIEPAQPEPEIEQVRPEPKPEPEPAPVLTEVFRDAEIHDAVVPEPVEESEPPQVVFAAPAPPEESGDEKVIHHDFVIEDDRRVVGVSLPNAGNIDLSPQETETSTEATSSDVSVSPAAEGQATVGTEKGSRPRGRPRSPEVLERDQAVFNALADGVEMTKAELAKVLGFDEVPVYQSLWRMQAQGHVKRIRHGRSHRWQQASQQGPTALGVRLSRRRHLRGMAPPNTCQLDLSIINIADRWTTPVGHAYY